MVLATSHSRLCSLVYLETEGEREREETRVRSWKVIDRTKQKAVVIARSTRESSEFDRARVEFALKS